MGSESFLEHETLPSFRWVTLLVGYRIGFERDFTIEQNNIEDLMADWRLFQTNSLV